MKITIITLFPQMFEGAFNNSILKRAQDRGLVSINYINIRDFGLSRHKVVDDSPYGGGIGMVLRVDVLYEAIQAARDSSCTKDEEKVILLDARGTTYSQKKAESLSRIKHIILLCGHYEGVDERIRPYVDETISIGDFILTGGEIPTMAIIDSVIRLIPGVITENATISESFTEKLLEYPHYTRPQAFNEMKVPDILMSGNHAEIEKWRKEQSLKITKEHRPDLIQED